MRGSNDAPVIERYKPDAPLAAVSDPGRHLLEVVVWMDIIKDPGWCEHTDVVCPTLTSVGWVVYEDDKYLKIADTLDEDGTGFGVMALPNGVIISRNTIRS